MAQQTTIHQHTNNTTQQPMTQQPMTQQHNNQSIPVYFVERYDNGRLVASRGYRSLISARIRWGTLKRIWTQYDIRIMYRFGASIDDVTPHAEMETRLRTLINQRHGKIAR